MVTRSLLLVALCAALSACYSAPIIMQDPLTGARADCGSLSEWTNWFGVANIRREENCTQSFLASGWKRTAPLAPGN